MVGGSSLGQATQCRYLELKQLRIQQWQAQVMTCRLEVGLVPTSCQSLRCGGENGSFS